MGEGVHERVVERLIDGLEAADISVMNELFTGDWLIVPPQSSETVRGKANRQALQGACSELPTITSSHPSCWRRTQHGVHPHHRLSLALPEHMAVGARVFGLCANLRTSKVASLARTS